MRAITIAKQACAGLLCLITLAGPLVAQAPSRGPVTDEQKQEARLLSILRRNIEVDFSETPLHEVVDFLKVTLDAPLVLDAAGLEAGGYSTDLPVSLKSKRLTARSALNLLLDKTGLTWVVTDEVILITTKEIAAKKVTRRIYYVGDLVKP